MYECIDVKLTNYFKGLYYITENEEGTYTLDATYCAQNFEYKLKNEETLKVIKADEKNVALNK